VHFPEGFGGLGLVPQLQREVDRRLSSAGAKPHGHLEFFGLAMAGPTIVSHGSDELQRRLLPAMFTGEDSWSSS
jgi:alkylation response protein AidB-like acyl-CoA dehydrogenase